MEWRNLETTNPIWENAKVTSKDIWKSGTVIGGNNQYLLIIRDDTKGHDKSTARLTWGSTRKLKNLWWISIQEIDSVQFQTKELIYEIFN